MLTDKQKKRYNPTQINKKKVFADGGLKLKREVEEQILTYQVIEW